MELIIKKQIVDINNSKLFISKENLDILLSESLNEYFTNTIYDKLLKLIEEVKELKEFSHDIDYHVLELGNAVKWAIEQIKDAKKNSHFNTNFTLFPTYKPYGLKISFEYDELGLILKNITLSIAKIVDA